MVRQDLVDNLVKAFPGITKKDMRLVVDGIFDSMAQALAGNDSVEIRGFGRMTLKQRRAGRARNPRTGTYTDLPERRVVRFKPSPHLIRILNVDRETESSQEGPSYLPEDIDVS